MSYRQEPGKKEKDLMKENDFNDFGALQQYRLEQYNGSGRANEIESDHQYMCALIDTEQSLRQTVQKEEYLKQLMEGKKDYYQGDSIKTRLQELAREYWILEQTWWRSWREIKEAGGYLTRGFELWRSHTQWYLHRVLREDCATRDGCCGRACGCCVKRSAQAPYTSNRKLGVGHCTVECACCIKCRGFDLNDTEKPPINDTARVSGLYEDSRCATKIKNVSIWGVLPGDNEHSETKPAPYIPKPVFPDSTLDLTRLSI